MRLIPGILGVAALAICPLAARADYLVLRNGARVNVSSYQVRGDRLRAQVAGGWAEFAVADVIAIEPEEIFVAAPKMPLEQAPFGELIRKAAAKYEVDADLVFSVVAAESNFNPKAVSRRNAHGLMQLLPETARRMGV